MKKIKFDYFDAADTMFEKGNFESALHYYFLESYLKHTKEQTADLYVAIADCYYEMELPSDAIRYLMRALTLYPGDEEILDRLYECYKGIDVEASFYYFLVSTTGEEGVTDFALAKMEEEFSEQEFTVHDSKDKIDTFNKAVELMEKGDRDESLKLFESIDKKSYQYSDAALARASFALDGGEFERALEIADEGLSVDITHIGLYTVKLVAYHDHGDKESVEKLVKELDELDLTEEEDVAKVALCMCHFGTPELAEKYLSRKLKYTPYDKVILLCLASAYMAKGDKKSAFKAVNTVCSIYPEDIEAEELSSRILSSDKIIMPDEILKLRSEWTKQIKELIVDGGEEITSPENIKKIKWLINGEDDLYLQSAVCAYISCCPELNKFVDELLIDPFVSLVVKKQIILRRVSDESVKRINVVVSNIFKSVKVRHPNVEDKLKFAYYYAFVALVANDYFKFESRLDYRFRRITSRYETCETKDEYSVDCIAALIYLETANTLKEKALELFDCDPEEFERAYKALVK